MSSAASRVVVLVVDDEPDHVMMLEIMLESVGYEVVTAASCEDGRAQLEHRRIDVLITDYFLGDGTAVELLEGIGMARPQLALVMSGLDATEAIESCLAAGYDAHLVKPTPMDKLLTLIAEGARRRRPSGIRLKKSASDTPIPRTKRSAGR